MKMANYVPFVYATPKGGECVVQRAKSFKTNGVPILVPMGNPPHQKAKGKTRVFPQPIKVDGGAYAYMVVGYSAIPQETWYLRAIDVSISAK